MNSDRNGGRKAAYRFPPQYALAGIAFAGFLIRLAGFFGPAVCFARRQRLFHGPGAHAVADLWEPFRATRRHQWRSSRSPLRSLALFGFFSLLRLRDAASQNLRSAEIQLPLLEARR